MTFKLQFLNNDTGMVKDAVFCFTGKSPKTRPEMEAVAVFAGGAVTKSVTNKTTILVIADASSTSSKARKARLLEIDLISPAQFFKMCMEADEMVKDTVQPKKIIKQFVEPKPPKKGKHSSVRRIQL